jgi:hydrogenase expression/formation protein HypC
MVDIAGVGKEISLALVDDVAVGDYVIVHVGYALTRLDPEEAEKTLALFAELGEAALREAGVKMGLADVMFSRSVRKHFMVIARFLQRVSGRGAELNRIRPRNDTPADQRHACPAAHFVTQEGRVLPLAAQRFRGDTPGLVGVEEANVGRTADGQRAGLDTENGGRITGDAGQRQHQRQPSPVLPRAVSAAAGARVR